MKKEYRYPILNVKLFKSESILTESGFSKVTAADDVRSVMLNGSIKASDIRIVEWTFE